VKNIAQRIFQKTLAAIDVRAAVEQKLDRSGPIVNIAAGQLDLRAYREIVAIAYGKAASGMAEGLAQSLAPEFWADGILVAPSPPGKTLDGWRTFVGGHPLPTPESFAAAQAILDRLARTTRESLIFFLLSGGGSALVEQPLDHSITIADFQQLHRALVTCGAPIEEINVIRKHLSATKGGRLAQAAPHAMKVTLAVSDVPAGQESALASGPTLPDPSTVADAQRIAFQYRLLEKLPATIRRNFEPGGMVETPKLGDPAFARAKFILLLSAHELVHAAHHAAEAEGFVCVCDDSTDNWPIDRASDHLLVQLEVMQRTYPGRCVAVIADGEVSSPVTGDGIGGRNSAFVLACVPKIAGRKISVLSAGTDGIDGNSPAAGAIADGDTLARAKDLGMSPAASLQRSDAYTFFEKLNDAVITGPTGNNLRDLRVLLAW
jgi:hydroxypyruvate reductase